MSKLQLKTKNFLFKNWPVVFIVTLWFIFSSPYFLKGLVPFPSRYLVDFFSPWNNFYGMPVKNNAMPDVINQIYPWKKITIDSWKVGQIPRWNPYQFAGNPHLANFQSAVFTPFNLLFFLPAGKAGVLPFMDAWSLLILLQPFLASLFMYLFLRELKISKEGSLLGSVAFAFSGFIVVWMAYGTLGYAILYLPLLLYGIERFFNKQDKLSLFLIVISIPLSIFSGHFQTSLYFLIGGFSYLLFKFFISRKFKLFAVCCLLFAGGLIISLPQLLPSIKFYQQSVRSEIFQKGEVIPWNYLISAFAPDFFGNPVTRNDWFGHYAEWASFIGVIPLLLALYVFLQKKKPSVVYFFAGLTLLSLLLAYPSPFVDFLIKLKIPVLSTSALSRIIVLVSFSLAALAGFGFDSLRKAWGRSAELKRIFRYLGFWGLIIAGVWLLLLSGNLLFVKDVNSEKLMVAKRNFILPTFLFIGGSGLFLLGFTKKKFIKLLVVSCLLLATSFDLLRFAVKWMPFDPKEFVYSKIAVLEFLEKNAGFERVFGNFGNEAQSIFGLYGIEGYDPLYIRRYGEFMTTATDGVIEKPSRSVVTLDKNGIYTKKILDLLGVKFILHSKGDQRNIWAFPFWLYPESFGGAVYSDEKYEIYENVRYFPRVFLVDSYKVAKSDQEIINLMFSEDTDLSQTVILEEPIPTIPENTILTNDRYKKLYTAEIIKYSPNEVLVNVESEKEGLLFLSDNYYSGWKAYVNGKETKIYRANYTFRAVMVPSGIFIVRFAYESRDL